MKVYLGLGSNLGDRRANITRAVDALARDGIHALRISPVVESPAMLPDDAPADWNHPFLNVVAECDVRDMPAALLDRLKALEIELGRGEHARWAPRTIDLDILLWGAERIATERLTVPHPGITERAFVLTPLAALAPLATIPGRGTKTVLEWSRAPNRHIPLWMGIVNVTPDSFSDGGRFESWPAVAAHVDALVSAGASFIDLGAESTRPGATPLDAEQEWARLERVLRPLLEKHASARLRPRFSVDTYHPATARRALALGVDVINDVGGLASPEMLELAAAGHGDWIAMHNLGLPADRTRTLPVDRDPVIELERWLEQRLEAWQRAGLDVGRIVFDPGIGFGKNPLQSLRVLRGIGRFERYGVRVLVGHSRKSFMHGLTSSLEDRDLFTIGASLRLCAQSVEILRVHDVAAHAAAYRAGRTSTDCAASSSRAAARPLSTPSSRHRAPPRARTRGRAASRRRASRSCRPRRRSRSARWGPAARR
jgi:2-amino-4-hydroxy-6-hydroxymethyldihydropteridine diphosphokinase/dihydropteroate synthase